jgi:hypothetical protein
LGENLQPAVPEEKVAHSTQTDLFKDGRDAEQDRRQITSCFDGLVCLVDDHPALLIDRSDLLDDGVLFGGGDLDSRD